LKILLILCLSGKNSNTHTHTYIHTYIHTQHTHTQTNKHRGGGRICPGRTLAIMELKINTMMLVRNYFVSFPKTHPKESVKFGGSIGFGPTELYVNFKPRNLKQ